MQGNYDWNNFTVKWRQFCFECAFIGEALEPIKSACDKRLDDKLIILPSFAHVFCTVLVSHYVHSIRHRYHSIYLQRWVSNQVWSGSLVPTLTWFIRNLIFETPLSLPSTQVILSPLIFLLLLLSLLATNWPSWNEIGRLVYNYDPCKSLKLSPWSIQQCIMTLSPEAPSTLFPLQWSCPTRTRRTRSCPALSYCTFPPVHIDHRWLCRWQMNNYPHEVANHPRYLLVQQVVVQLRVIDVFGIVGADLHNIGPGVDVLSTQLLLRLVQVNLTEQWKFLL